VGAIDAWRRALGGRGEATVLPPPPAPPGAPIAAGPAIVVPAASIGATVPPAVPPALDAARSPGAAVAPPPPPLGAPVGLEPASPRRRGPRPPRRALFAAGAAALLVALVVGIVAVASGGDDKHTPEPVAAPDTTVTAPTTTVAAAPVLEVLSPASGTESPVREVELAGRTDAGATVTVDGVAATVAADGTWRGTKTLSSPETKLAVVAKNAAGVTKTVEWVLRLDSTPPPLTITDPADGATVASPVVTLHGTTEPNATVRVDGVGAGPDPAGSNDSTLGWAFDVTINGAQQTFQVTSTDRAGNVTTVPVTLHYEAPPSQPRTQPPSKPPTEPTPKPPTEPTPEPTPTLVARDDSVGPYNWGGDGSYISFNVVGNDTGSWSRIEFTGPSRGYGSLERNGSFFIYTPTGNGPFTDSFTYRLVDANGAASNWATVTITFLCNASYPCNGG
jgi:hypothetical protein